MMMDTKQAMGMHASMHPAGLTSGRYSPPYRHCAPPPETATEAMRRITNVTVCMWRNLGANKY